MNILVSGPLLSMSGYGNHARQVLEFVFNEYKNENIFCDVKSWGKTNWNLTDDFLSDGIISKIIDNFISETELIDFKGNNTNNHFDISFQIYFPSEWDTSLAKKNIGVFAGIESTLCCEKWLDKISIMSEVIVPSKHALDSIMNAKEYFLIKKIETPIHIIPEWFYVEIGEESDVINNIMKKIKTDNNLLIMGQITGLNPELDRKNIIKTLDSCIEYLIESKKEDVGIILKLFSENNSLIDFVKIRKIVKAYINIIKQSNDYVPSVYIVHGNMMPKEVMSLYNHEKVTCLVSGTRGEGFGLTFLEAAACGLPIIATNWSAHTEFLAGEYFIKLNYKLEKVPERLNVVNSPVHEYSNIWVKDAKWAEFDKDDLKKKLEKVLDLTIEYNKIADQQKTILNNYSKNTIMGIYKQQFGR
jgi:glycosyltransferase involved in cell wall biosynthesis